MKVKKVIGRRVLIKPIREEYKGKLIVPEQIKKRPRKGRILKVGQLRDYDLKVGDIVHYDRFTEQIIGEGDTPEILINEGNLIAIENE